VPGGTTGPPCQWGTLIQGPGPSGWGWDARLTILLCKKIFLRNPKKRKPEYSLAEASKKGCYANDEDDEAYEIAILSVCL
jgi:hypothetical protein